ncbi:MAG: SDR family NAD(P)-dependent oxidoreductase [Candidatus Lokiarchaeota archaeon]|nr:SDR family NAD(P)-dependent oxidoreductase [Candidatus Lokiarchaeota archaeon]
MTYTALVTGGAGFIGSHLVDHLIKKNYQLTVIDDLSAGNLDNLKQIKDSIKFFKGDIANIKFIKDVFKEEFDFIFHIAANASVPISVNKPRLDFSSNAIGTFNLLEASKDSGTKKFIYASTAAVYGEPKYTPIDEKHPLAPISPYGASKLAGEACGFSFVKAYGIRFTSMRIFNCIGPRQPRYVIYDFLNKLLKNKTELEILGTGENVRDFIYVDDVCNAFIQSAEKKISDGEAYSLGTGKYVTITQLANQILENLNLDKTKLKYTGFSWKGDVKVLIADNSKALKHFNLKITPLADALDHEIKWFQENVSKIM